MLAALDRDHRAYRTACLCRGFNGLVAAVSAGIGVSAVAASMIPASLAPLDGEHRLPRLGHIEVVLMTNPRTAERSQVQAFTQTILSRASSSLGVDGAAGRPVTD
jgi:DNA-binding transcriptional LysR family regulator